MIEPEKDLVDGEIGMNDLKPGTFLKNILESIRTTCSLEYL